MIFPDQLRMDHVTEALWQTGGGASVMVGSGFSRNSRPRNLNRSPMSMLEDIAAAMRCQLYLEDTDRGVPPEQLAQEYEVEYGETKLHHLLRNMIADSDYVPGSFHKRLLKMPWSDVFTTNWDTLLERARTKIPERPYTVVRAPSDLPSSSRPRIVKLHGSLPDPPLILTEESYRTYPNTHAPFVNTVQQAMMETVVLLLGFSGEDPNFLHWSGWVRDNLGGAAPKIYLAGYLRLSRTRRRMLEARNVVPIDLAEHPRIRDSRPDPRCHRRATDWILTSLEFGKPYDQTLWPKPPPKPRGIDPRIEPVARQRSTAPVSEPKMTPHGATSSETDKDRVAKAVDAWRHNRECYPGWIVFPRDMRPTQRLTVQNWVPIILEVLPELGLLERLDVLYEVVWRIEKSLAWMPAALETAADGVLAALDCDAQTVAGDSTVADWRTIRIQWREVALSLLTAARYRLDADAFEARLNRLKDYMSDNSDVAQRIEHERCLWLLWDLDFESLEESLGAWDAGGADPMWKVRKAALLRNVGRDEEADELVQEAMAEIRAARESRQDFAASSREGWALWSAMSLDALDGIRERWRQLAPAKCDAEDVWDIRSALERGDREGQTAPHFDLGVRRTEQVWFRSNTERDAVTYGSVRLTEVAGLPNAIDSMDVARLLLKLAAEHLTLVNPEVAMRLVLRAASTDSDRTLQRVLSRESVAGFQEERATRLCDAARRLALHAISRVETDPQVINVTWLNCARVALEGWSRLVLRTDDKAATGALRDALALHGRSLHFWLHDALGSLLRRSWEAMSQSHRMTFVLDLLETPVSTNDDSLAMSRYPEPGDLVIDLEQPPSRTSENESRWVRIIDELVQALAGGGVARRLASARLSRIASWGLLTSSESARIAAGWWSSEEDGDGLLPVGTALYDYAFVVLPEPEPGLGRSAFARKWLTGDASQVKLTVLYRAGTSVGSTVSHHNPHKADDILFTTGRAVAFLRHHNRSLAFSSSELAFVTGVVERWIETNLHVPEDIPDLFIDPPRRSLEGAIEGLSWLLSDIRLPVPLALALNQKVKELHDARLPEPGVPAFAILPGILRSNPELLDDVELTMARGLASNAESMARSAFRALHRWLLWESDEKQPSPPSHLVREVGLSIAARRPTALGEALSVAQWIFEKGRMEHGDAVRDLVLAGMGYLLEELRYDQEVSESALDIPPMRWRCIRVARAIAAGDPETPEVVRRWLEIGRDDPLPEVRHIAADWWRSEGRMAE